MPKKYLKISEEEGTQIIDKFTEIQGLWREFLVKNPELKSQQLSRIFDAEEYIYSVFQAGFHKRERISG